MFDVSYDGIFLTMNIKTSFVNIFFSNDKMTFTSLLSQKLNYF